MKRIASNPLDYHFSNSKLLTKVLYINELVLVTHIRLIPPISIHSVEIENGAPSWSSLLLEDKISS